MSQIMDFLVQTSCVSSDLLKEIMRDYLSGKKQKSGLKSFNKLAKTGVLESIEITDNNIKDFLSTANKYDIDFALTRDKSTSPPTYRIFFQSGKEENFQKAFKEYAFGTSKKLDKKSVTQVVNREQIKQNAKVISEKQAAVDKEKSHNKSNLGR